MKKLFTLILLLVFSAAGVWAQLSQVTVSHVPEKNVSKKQLKDVNMPPTPLGILQGGENIATATVILSLPYTDIGTTAGYLDNYNEVCPYTATGGLDVVYKYMPAIDGVIDISLCGDATAYDTKLYVYDTPAPVTGDAIACSDDICSTLSYPNPYVSEISGVPVTAGTTYYIVVDGYSTLDYGTYELSVVNGITYPVPPNDNCSGATEVIGPFPQTVNGTTLGATVDCPGVLDWNAVWYAIVLPYAINDLTVDWCGTENMSTVGVVYYETCPVSCLDYYLYTSNIWQVCGTPTGATTGLTSFTRIPGPATIYYPAYSLPQMNHVITFNVTEVTCPAPLDLVAVDITLTGANLTWTPGGTETGWEYAYGPAPFPVPAGPGIATSSNTVNPISGLTAETNYQFYVRANCDGDFSPWTSPAAFYTGYCIPAPTSVDGLGITNVSFSTVNNTTLDEPGNYGDYSALIGDVQQSAMIPVLITYETGYTYETKIWIDWNDDLDFDDPGEEVYLGTSLSDNPTTLAASFIVPGTATLGNHRMRIGGIDFGTLTPCYTGIYGSFEDYTVNVTAAPDCIAPTGLATTGITDDAAILDWNGPIDSFFDVFFGPGSDPFTGSVVSGVIPPYTVSGLDPQSEYSWAVRTDCGFTEPKVDNFWMAMGESGMLDPLLSGGTFNETGEDGKWYEYPNAPGYIDWWNVWFYNDPLDTTRLKKVRMGFWVQPLVVGPISLINYVINWSDSTWHIAGRFPNAMEEDFILRSPINGPIIVNGLQWVELYFVIPDFNPEWISVDIWGENIIIPLMVNEPLPAWSLLGDYWIPGDPGGVIVHECLPRTSFSTWIGPEIFTTQCIPLFSLPVTESFEGTTWPPECWTDPVALNYGWNQGPYGDPRTGTGWAYCNLAGSTLTSRSFSLTEDSRLSFWYRAEADFSAQDMVVKIGNTVIHQITDAVNTTYQEVQIPLGAYTGQTVEISFTGETGTGDFAYGICLDDVTIEAIPFIWTGGALNDEWNVAGNWDRGSVPTLTSVVRVPVVVLPAVYPVIKNGQTVNCGDLLIQIGAAVNVEVGGFLNVKNQ